MKTAVEEIREALERAFEVTSAMDLSLTRDRLKRALARLAELERHIAKAEERGRNAGYDEATLDAHAIVRTRLAAIPNADALDRRERGAISQAVWRDHDLREVMSDLMAGNHRGAADRAKGAKP